MKQLLLLLSFTLSLSLISLETNAQSYDQAIGARLGFPLSVSYKTFLGGGNGALEIMGSLRRDGNVFGSLGWTRFGAGAAYQLHYPLEDVIEDLYWYAGAGASVYFWSYDNDPRFDGEDNLSFGLQGYIGLDYRFDDAPVNVSIDWSPTVLINGFNSGFGVRFYSLAVRYILND